MRSRCGSWGSWGREVEQAGGSLCERQDHGVEGMRFGPVASRRCREWEGALLKVVESRRRNGKDGVGRSARESTGASSLGFGVRRAANGSPQFPTPTGAGERASAPAPVGAWRY